MNVRRQEVIRIPPERLGEDYISTLHSITRETLEGKILPDKSLNILVSDIDQLGEGKIVHGDGAIYQKVEYTALVFKPAIQEIVDGEIVEVLKFGAFVRFGAFDGLLHVSQIMDDRIDVDAEGQRLVGKDTKKDIKKGDKVRARIVALSINERNPRESKIGLTMRQNALGKFDWIEDERKKADKSEKGKEKGKKEEKKEKKEKKEEKKEK